LYQSKYPINNIPLKFDKISKLFYLYNIKNILGKKIDLINFQFLEDSALA